MMVCAFNVTFLAEEYQKIILHVTQNRNSVYILTSSLLIQLGVYLDILGVDNYTHTVEDLICNHFWCPSAFMQDKKDWSLL